MASEPGGVVPDFEAAGIIDIGVPVFDGHGQITAALTVSSLRMKNAKQGVKELLPALKECAESISKGL
jgi:DNA-binding IclR family transcriptional regulator